VHSAIAAWGTIFWEACSSDSAAGYFTPLGVRILKVKKDDSSVTSECGKLH